MALLTGGVMQLPFMEEILMELKEGSHPQSRAAQGCMDFSNVGVAGHSRGGKLAALQYARKFLTTQSLSPACCLSYSRVVT